MHQIFPAQVVPEIHRHLLLQRGASRAERIAEDRAALQEQVPVDCWPVLRRETLVDRDAPLPGLG